MNVIDSTKALKLVNSTKLLNIVFAAGLIFAGYFIAKKVSQLVEKPIKNRFSLHHAQLVRRISFYILFSLFLISGLQHMGFNLSVLLGAAGIFTVAVSFASQTAASNLISGIFLLFERPFKVGDSIEVKAIQGTVDSIDLLSTKLRTSDNRLVRIPNETMIKSEIVNLSYFHTRRIDLIIPVAYTSNIDQVKQLLLDLATQCTHALEDPKPAVIVDNFADYAIQLKLMVWVLSEDLQSTKNNLQEMIKTGLLNNFKVIY